MHQMMLENWDEHVKSETVAAQCHVACCGCNSRSAGYIRARNLDFRVCEKFSATRGKKSTHRMVSFSHATFRNSEKVMNKGNFWSQRPPYIHGYSLILSTSWEARAEARMTIILAKYRSPQHHTCRVSFSAYIHD